MTICLAMIVRDNAAILPRCLRAIRERIDCWTILDTGSTDDTVEVIERELAGIRGQLHRHDFEGFAGSRSRLLELARESADWILMLDADMKLAWPDTPLPDADVIEGRLQLGSIDYALPLLIRGDREWRYEGVAHACLISDLPYTTIEMPGLSVAVSASTGVAKLERDLAALSREHAEKPLDPRTTFYLAQTYQDLGRPFDAIQHYRTRAEQVGWDEETFYARYRLGCLLGENVNGLAGMRELLEAYAMRPGRAEPLRALANLANSIADKIPYPADRLFVHPGAYISRPVSKAVSDVSAVIVTRGDVDLQPILDTLPYRDIVIWNNSKKPEDAKCYGRFLGMAEAKNALIYFQDDDVIFTRHTELRAAHEDGRITANMPSPWYENAGYDLEQSVQVGAGSILDRSLPQAAFDAYLAEWPLDDLFLTYCDDIAGILSPSYRVDLGYTVLPHASAPGRIYTTPGSRERRAEVARRVFEIRERAAVV